MTIEQVIVELIKDPRVKLVETLSGRFVKIVLNDGFLFQGKYPNFATKHSWALDALNRNVTTETPDRVDDERERELDEANEKWKMEHRIAEMERTTGRTGEYRG